MAWDGGVSMGSTTKLKKSLGLMNGVAIIVGIMIGSGIFVSPKGVLQEVGSVGGSLIIWLLCGVISLIGALCYAELGTCILKSGADYAYINEAFGGLPAFLYLWVALIVIIPTGNAVVALTFGYYAMQPAYPTCEPPDEAVRILAALAITFLTFINCWNVKWAARVQDVFTVAKVLALVIIIIIGFVQICRGKVENFYNAFDGTTENPAKFALAFYSGLFSYAGWNYLNFVTEELKDPYRNLPRAIWISMPLVTGIYCLANIAYYTVLTPAALLASNAVAVTFADKMLGVMAWIMPFFVAASTFGGLNGVIFTAARLFFVGARNGHMPDCLALINIKFITPLPAIIFQCLMTLLMLVSGDVYVLINYASFVESLFIGISIAGLLWLRYKRPNMERPIKVHLVFPIFFMFIMLYLIIFPLFNNASECFMGLVVIATGVPVYWLCVVWQRKPKVITSCLEKFTILSQKLFLAVEEEVDEIDEKQE
ncbi:hypothetical protein CAPTEDRAFT_212253 [Capitella teleta]|uniref:Amino acid permease/ SLC12A domain-containing protein n=1 Tax=Capitella teleta TaxID=283909 RepID=R7TJ72_CAPTE|nr:hypothetical protein CAPTEDRAFT_212253 [Capitella teleta]|eukprot:ELT93754.1 hypothetical protein CAPTEDRAFT_212253 [Capitella teleta]